MDLFTPPFFRYDTREGKWRWLEPMHTSRSAVDIAVVDGALYAVGGNDGCSSLNTVEKLVLFSQFTAVCNLRFIFGFIMFPNRASMKSCM